MGVLIILIAFFTAGREVNRFQKVSIVGIPDTSSCVVCHLCYIVSRVQELQILSARKEDLLQVAFSCGYAVGYILPVQKKDCFCAYTVVNCRQSSQKVIFVDDSVAVFIKCQNIACSSEFQEIVGAFLLVDPFTIPVYKGFPVYIGEDCNNLFPAGVYVLAPIRDQKAFICMKPAFAKDTRIFRTGIITSEKSGRTVQIRKSKIFLVKIQVTTSYIDRVTAEGKVHDCACHKCCL